MKEALGNKEEEEKKEEKKEEESKTKVPNPMEQSFYRKQGIDFLSFKRPGTAYSSKAF